MILCIVLTLVTPARAILAARSEIYSPQNVPKHDVAIVFGAGIYPDNTPTPFLKSRLLTAVALYKMGRVHVLVMSGDNSTVEHDEPVVMRAYAISQGVPADSIVLDYAGYDTYDTCYRLRNLFDVTSAILVTHAYHLARALLTCNTLGIKSVGVKADKDGSAFSKNYLVREFFSLNKAGIQLIFKPRPEVLGPKELTVMQALTR